MADTHRSLLLQSSHKPISSCKILFFTVFITVMLISAYFLLPNPASKSNICHGALNPEACRSFVSEVDSGVTPLSTIDLLKKMLIKQVHRMDAAILQTKKLKNKINDGVESGALADCMELIDLSTDLVMDSFNSLENQSTASHVYLSGVLTNHVTCSDGLGMSGRKFLGQTIEDLITRTRASLAVLTAVSQIDDESFRLKLPPWITAADRKLLESTAGEIKADVTVAKDGSGNYKTVAEAIAAAPSKSNKRYVIRVKKGTYKENVEIDKNKKNIMIVGDGMSSTIITGDRNVVDGSTTFRSATLATVGEGFILQDICIQNRAGPEKHQAVALRVGADRSVINRCRIEAFQDTLYAHSLRQFYRDCTITGTVDFIFGDAAVVFQKCKLLARKPMKAQKNMVTAQGRTDPNQNTGTSIQDCEIKATEDLEAVKSEYPTYLGRPWKEFSRTVVMQSYIGDHIDPAGWSEWSGDFALKTLYYGEFMNRGPGAGTGRRVKWAGYHVIRNAVEAMKFTVKELIHGGLWLGSTGVAYTEGL